MCLIGCGQKETSETIDELAKEYVKLGLFIGQFEPGFVDYYYGPDSLKPNPRSKLVFNKDSLMAMINSLNNRLGKLKMTMHNDSTVLTRIKWLEKQLDAFNLLVRNISGERVNFDEETLHFFSVKAPIYDEQHFQSIVKEIDNILPGVGSTQERYQKLLQKFTIPSNRIDTIFKVAMAEGRRKTLEHLNLPKEENIKMEFVRGQPWNAFNSYKGNYTSLILVNLDYPISIFDALSWTSHEGYPGHHTNFVMIEKTNVRGKGWIEQSLLPIYSPQAFMSEGIAENGLAMIFPENTLIKFLKDVLLPITKSDTTGINAFCKASQLHRKLEYLTNETYRGLINNMMSKDENIEWRINYLLQSKELATDIVHSLNPSYGFSYSMSYNYGEDLVRNYLQTNSNPEDENSRWNTFSHLICAEIIPSDLLLK